MPRSTRQFARLATLASIALGTRVLAQPAPKAAPVFVNGMAQIVPAFQDSSTWIRQELWVETNFDTDHDGKKDRVHVDVTRPRQTETEGLKVSILYGSSPYYAGTARGQVNWNVQQELNDQPQPRGAMASPRVSAESVAHLQRARQRVGAARLRRRALRGAGHGTLAGMSDRRRRSRTHADEVRRRLAQRSREGLHDADRQRGSEGDVVVDRQSRHDRHVVRGHAAARRGDDRRAGTRGRRARVAEHVVLPLLPLQWTRALARRLPRRRRRRALRLHRQRRHRRPRELREALEERHLRRPEGTGSRDAATTTISGPSATCCRS